MFLSLELAHAFTFVYRHLLQELSVAQYVPNDTYLAGGKEQLRSSSEGGIATSRSSGDLPSVLIITGPNNSGKSVYMKQVALIVYLAQVGRRVLRWLRCMS
jgi:DNA mismatch repair protein MSH5